MSAKVLQGPCVDILKDASPRDLLRTMAACLAPGVEFVKNRNARLCTSIT